MSAHAGPPNPIRVLMVDDHAVFRRGLREVLDAEADIEVVGEAGDGEAALEQAARLRPDVVLMDIRMPKMDGLEAARRLHASLPEVRVLMLTVSEREEDLFAAIRAGAAGYLSKAIALEELPVAVRAVAEMPTRAAEPAAPAPIQEPARAPVARLTERELAVLRLVARGRTNREIGASLTISENTVKNHLRNILLKLGVHSRTDAVLRAVRDGILEVGDPEGGPTS